MNNILRRRRDFLSEKSAQDPTIYGSRLTWIQGGIDASTGSTTVSEYAISTVDYIPFSDKKVLTYIGPATNINGAPYYVYAALYDTSFNFLKRELIYFTSSHVTTFQVVNQSVGYIKISYGHNANTGELVDPSEGSEFVCLVQDRSEVKNGFVNGTYANGTSSCSISNNILSISTFDSGQDNRPNVYFKYPLNIQTGDTVRVLITKKSGSVSGAIYVDAWVAGNKIVGNKAWGTGNTALDQTLSSPGNSNTKVVVFNNRTGNKTYTNYKCSIQIFVNSVQVLPEV